MHGKQRSQNSILRTISRATTTVLASVFVLAIILCLHPTGAGANLQGDSQFCRSPRRRHGLRNDAIQWWLDRKRDLQFRRRPERRIHAAERCDFRPVRQPLWYDLLGGASWGTVYELTPSGSGWTEQILHNFQNGDDGIWPIGGLLLSPSGNLYGTTSTGGTNGGGTVFELQPLKASWIYTLFYSFTGSGGPEASLTMDAGGSLYGTTYYDGAYGWGSVFKLTPSNGGWSYTSLHDFTGENDGSRPISDVIFDAQGNLYGTASLDGANGQGVVWEITP